MIYALILALVAIAIVGYFYFFRILPLRELGSSVASLFLGDNDQCLVLFNDKKYQYLEKKELKKYFEKLDKNLKNGHWMVQLVDNKGYIYKPDKNKEDSVSEILASLGLPKYQIYWREDKQQYIEGIVKESK